MAAHPIIKYSYFLGLRGYLVWYEFQHFLEMSAVDISALPPILSFMEELLSTNLDLVIISLHREQHTSNHCKHCKPVIMAKCTLPTVDTHGYKVDKNPYIKGSFC